MELEKLLVNDKITVLCQTKICLQNIISNFTNNKNELWKSVRLTSFQKPHIIDCSSVALFVFTVYTLIYSFSSCFDRLFLGLPQFGSGSGLNFGNVRDTAHLSVVSLDKRVFTLPRGV